MTRLRLTTKGTATATVLGLALGLLPAMLGSEASAAGMSCKLVTAHNASLCEALALQRNPDGSLTSDVGALDGATAPTAPTTTTPTTTDEPAQEAPAVGSPSPSTSGTGSASLLAESFDGGDGAFVGSSDFWSTSARGLSQNAEWFAEGGDLQRVGSAGKTSSPVFRMWTRRSDLAYTTAEMDIRFDGWSGGSEGWHGVNLWMNKALCTPVPECTAVGDDGGNSGYVLDFVNRDGNLTILKKAAGDTRATWPTNEIGHTQGGTYYWLKSTPWTPTVGQDYRFGGRVLDNGDGTSTLQILIDGEVRLQVVDDATIGGPRLNGGRVGLRSDYADITVDNLTVSR